MFHWLVQAQDAHPDLARGIPPIGLLSEMEEDKFLSLKSEKRRRDWLLGRWTAKHLLQRLIKQQTGENMPLNEIIITNDRDGVPLFTVHCSLFTDYGLSLSHCDGRAFCVVTERPSQPIGADMEKIEPRLPGFAEDYFTEAELIGLRNTEYRIRDLLITAVWSAKEAVLKALHLGLSVDTRAVTCLFAPVERPSTWQPFTIHCDEGRLGRTAVPLTGWWRSDGNYILTFVVGTSVPSDGTEVPTTNDSSLR